MSDLKITIEQLKNYLGTGLKFVSLVDEREDDFDEVNDSPGFDIAFNKGSVWEFVGWSDISLPMGEGEFEGELLKHPEFGFYRGNYNSHKPICYRLSDLDKFIPELGFVPIKELSIGLGNIGFITFKEIILNRLSFENIPYWAIKQLFQWHFWPFGENYFEKGLVIDKMTFGKEASNG